MPGERHPTPSGRLCFSPNWPEGAWRPAPGIPLSPFCLLKLCMLQQEHLHLIIFTLIIFGPANPPPPTLPPLPLSLSLSPHTHTHTHVNLRSSTGSNWQGRVRVKQSPGLSFCLFICGASVTDSIISVLPFHFLSCFFPLLLLFFHPNINSRISLEQALYFLYSLLFQLKIQYRNYKLEMCTTTPCCHL